MATGDINSRLAEVEGKRESLDKRIFDEPGLDPKERQSLVEESLTLAELERRLENERLRSVEPRERVAKSRAKEKRRGDQLLRQPWHQAFGDKAMMAREVQGCSLASVPGLDEYQAAAMKYVLDAFIRVHKAAEGTATKGGLSLLDLCQRVIMAVLNETNRGDERELPRNMDWVLAQLHYGMDDVVTFVESLVYERPTPLHRVLYKLGVVAESPLARVEQLEVTLRGILAVVQSRDALPKLPTTDSATSNPEERQDSTALPLPWDAYAVAQSLYDFAVQLGQSPEKLPLQERLHNFQAGEALCRQAVKIWEHFLWHAHPQLTQGYATLAALVEHQGAITSSEAEDLHGMKVDRLESQSRPSTLPHMAAVPAGALALPHSYVERAAEQKIADGLTNPEEPATPFAVVGMGGGGKSVLASAVVRKSSVREYFRGGIFWVRVGRGAKKSLLPLLQSLATEMSATPTDTPHGMPHILDRLEQVQQHSGVVVSTGTSPRLVVLDDVWEREVVDALLPLGLKLLVTTRDRSVVGVPTRCMELGDATEEEALELLLKTSRTVGQPGDAVRTQMTKVAALCGRLPLVLAIAGSMPVVQGKGLTAGAWKKLIEELKNVATKMEASDADSNSLNVVLETSFAALTKKKRKEVLKTAVLAPGAVASTEMLLNLWETEDTGETREEAEGLVSKCLLQDVGGGGYREHDLVLDFVKFKIKADGEMVTNVTTLQAHFLGRLDVLEGYERPEHGADNEGLFVLDALWRSVEQLSGDPELEVASYFTSLRRLESCEATTDVASSYASVGFLLNIQGKYSEAEPLYERSLAIREKALGPDHPDVAQSLNNCAELLRAQGKSAEAEPLYRRATEIWETALGADHPNVATALNNRAGLLKSQGKYDEADPLYQRASEIWEKYLGPEHPSVATALNNRAGLLESQGKYAEAEPLYERSQAIREKVLGLEHPDVASSLNNRAALLRAQGKFDQAEPLYERAIAIWEASLGSDHPQVATGLNNRAALLHQQGKYDEADTLYLRAIESGEKTLGPHHPSVATRLNNRAGLLEIQGKYDEADSLYRRAIEIGEKVLGPDHPDLATRLNNRAGLLRAQGKYDDAAPLHQRALAIDEKVLGPDHPDVASDLNNWAELLSAQGKYSEAEPLLVRAIAIGEKALGPEHPDLAVWLNNRAGLLESQGKYVEAGPLYERSLAISEKVYGHDHPAVATGLNNRAWLLESQGKHNEAIPLLERASSIRRKKLGEGHHSTVDTQITLERVRKHVREETN